jgi:hypothetical protein
MWIIKNICGDRSTQDIRTTNIWFRVAGNNGEGCFSTLEPNKWYSEDKDSKFIMIEFECINEIKNLRKNLKRIIKDFKREQKIMKLERKIAEGK